MTSQPLIPLVLVTVLTVYLAIAWRTWARVHGTRVVVCPETKRPVAVKVDVGHAMTTAIWEKPDVRLTACSRWPEGQDCDQLCVRQIETDPSETQPKVIAAHFLANRQCAICRRVIQPPSSVTLQPGFMDPVTNKVEAWDELAPQSLPEAIVTRRALCENCTLAESFRERFPEKVIDRRRH
jgi:hypothetical protein